MAKGLAAFLLLFSVTLVGAQEKTSHHADSADTLVCEKEFTNINSWNYTTGLKREAVGMFTVIAGDSIRYSVFREKMRKALFSIYNSEGKVILETLVDGQVATGKVGSVVAGNYYFKIRSKRLWPNNFIVTIKKRNCAYQQKVVAAPVFVMDTTVKVKFDSTIYLASRLDLKHTQRIIIPVDSLQGSVVYEIKSSGGPVRYRFFNAQQQEVRKGNGVHDNGEFRGASYRYSLLIENEDRVVGKHVYIYIKQVHLKRRLLGKK